MKKKATINIGKILEQQKNAVLPVDRHSIVKLNKEEKEALLAYLKEFEVSDVLKGVIKKLEVGD
jgi:hypothetical protein